jgi:hypothetical protein
LGGRDGSECDDFWGLWFSSDRIIKLIQQWFTQAQKASSLNLAEIAWMTAASESAQDLLKPLATTAAKMWLTKSGYDSDAYRDKSEFQVWFLKGYLALCTDGKLPDNLINFVWARDGNFYGMTGEEIESMAEWAGLEKTTHWYTGVGWILYELGETDRALELLAKAIELVSFA